jgi:hypothetical protein
MNQVEFIYGLGMGIELRRLDPKLRQAYIRTQPARPEAALGNIYYELHQLDPTLQSRCSTVVLY